MYRRKIKNRKKKKKKECGCEAAVHAIYKMYKEEHTEAVLVVDAASAFNSVIRKVFLHNINVVCSSISI